MTRSGVRTGRPLELCVVGDALLDVDWNGTVDRVCRDAPAPVLETPAERARPGGAALAAVLAAASRRPGDASDRAERRCRRTQVGRPAEGAAVRIVDLGLDGPTPVKLRLRAGEQSIAGVGCSPIVPPGPWSSAAERDREADALLVSDYGRGVAALQKSPLS